MVDQPEPPERRKDLVRRYRCRIWYARLNRSEKWITLATSIVKKLAIAALLTIAVWKTDHTPQWVLDLIARL